MGCTQSDNIEPVTLKDMEYTSNNNISDRQILLIKHSWRQLAVDMTGVGKKIFLKIFELNPEIKLLFPFSNTTEEELLRNPLFKGHASRFMQAVDAAVNNINNWDSFFTPLLQGLGRQHSRVKEFKYEYLQVFSDAIMCVWESELGESFNEEMKQAWDCVFTFIMRKLQEGYNYGICSPPQIEISR